MGTYTEPVQPYPIESKIAELLAENKKCREMMNLIEQMAPISSGI